MRKHLPVLLLSVCLLAGMSIVAARCIPFGVFQDAPRLRAWILAWGDWAPAAIIALQTIQVLLAPIPGQVVGAVSGYLFGVRLGTLYSILGTTLGSLLSIGLVRVFGRPLVERIVPTDMLARLDAGAQRRGVFFLAVVFLLPFLPDDLACFAAGLTPMPVPALLLVVVLGRLPGLWVSCWLGANATGLNTPQWSAVIGASIVLAVVLLRYGERLTQAALELTERIVALR